MASKTINLKEFSRELGRFTDATLEQQKTAVAGGLARSIPDLVENSPVDTGQYAASWNFTITENSAIIGNFAPHAPLIENGARPFTPPIAPLLAWAKRVLQDPSQPPNYSPRVWALARGTQNKIAQHGMEPKAVLEKATPIIIENIRLEFEQIK